MKVYISVDIEGVAGVVDRSHGSLTGGAEFALGRRLMTLETNAAIEGALEAGATEFVVNDSHGPMINLLPEELNPKATLIQGRYKHLFMVEGLDDSFDAMFLVGYHASAGVPDGVLNHAFHPYELRYNGTVWSETGLNASVAGYYGVPVALVTGDDAAIRDSETILPPHVGVSVKRGITRFSGESLHPEVARERIKAAAREAIEQLDGRKPLIVGTPLTVDIDFYHSIEADWSSMMPGVERTGNRSVRYVAPDALRAYRTFLASYYLSRSVTA
ncbi:MAG TPA: M55 family metallopeptidase [Nitrolancea sp.]|jgi:D-amino peptidase|nr:M55 family metallopeptidase [Nitrolancea sp.]